MQKEHFKNTILKLEPPLFSRKSFFARHFKNTILKLELSKSYDGDPDPNFKNTILKLEPNYSPSYTNKPHQFQKYYIKIRTPTKTPAPSYHANFKNTILKLEPEFYFDFLKTGKFQKYYIKIRTKLDKQFFH